MTFASATIQGKVMWIEMIMGGKEENRPTTQMIISVPDKRSRTETEDGKIIYTRNTTYSARIWDNQAITAHKYIDKYQTITITGTITNAYRTKAKESNGIMYPEGTAIGLDFCNVIDYGVKQEKKTPETKKKLASVK